MPTVIDALTITLGLDARQYQQGQAAAVASIGRTRETADRAAKDMEASGKRAAQFFSTMKTEALSLIGVLAGTAGLGLVLRNSAESMAALGRAAANLNLDPQRLAAWNNVFERNGAAADSFTVTLTGLQKTLRDLYLAPNPQFYGALGQIGATPEEGPLGILMKFMRFVEEHPHDVAAQNQIANLLGVPADITQAARQMGTVAEAMRELQNELTRVPTKEMTKEAIELQKAWEDFAHQTKFIGDTITANLSGPLVALLNTMTQLEAAHPDLVIGLTLSGAALSTLTAIRGIAAILGMAGLVAAIDATLPAAVVVGGAALLTYEVLPHLQNATPEQGRAVARQRIDEMTRTRNRAEIARQLAGYGYTPAQIAGVMSNVDAESGFNPAATGDNGQAYGLFQWHPDRQAAFRLWAGHDIRQSTIAEQVAFAQWELTHTESAAGGALRGATTPQQAGAAFSLGFERPAGGIATAANRGARAGSFVPSPAGAVLPGVGAGGSPTTIDVQNMNITLPGVTDAPGFARALPGAITTQSNRGLR